MSALPQTRPRAATGLSLAARAKRWLYLLHRWAGITLCLFFAMWFISGVVMMYVGYPAHARRAPGAPGAAGSRRRHGDAGRRWRRPGWKTAPP